MGELGKRRMRERESKKKRQQKIKEIEQTNYLAYIEN